MAFFIKLLKNKFTALIIVFGFSFAIFMPFFYSSANAESYLLRSDSHGNVFWNQDNKAIINYVLPNGIVAGSIDGNAFSSGVTTNSATWSYVFGFIPYEVTYAGETEILDIQVLSTGKFVFNLHLPKPVWNGSTMSYDVSELTTVPIYVGWNPDDNTYTNGLFSVNGYSINGVTFSTLFSAGYMRFTAVTGGYTGNYAYNHSTYFLTDVPSNYVSNVDIEAVAQALAWLRNNNASYFNGGANVSSYVYDWYVFTQYGGQEIELKRLEENIKQYIQESNNEVKALIEEIMHQGEGEFDELDKEIGDITTDIDNSNEIIGSVDKPNVDDIGSSIDSIISDALNDAIGFLALQRIGDLIFKQNFFLGIITLSLAVGLIKYIFFGKR